jgi:uncharacterized protein
MSYVAPYWLPGGHLQTIWPALFAKSTTTQTPHYIRSRWTTPDGDFIDVDEVHLSEPEQNAPLLVMFHGLEGSSQSHYALAMATHAAEQGWNFAVPHFRGCSGEINLAPRAYHSGDFAEIDWVLKRFRSQHAGPIIAVGISMGGNALLRWAAETQSEGKKLVKAVAAVCSPLDLAACGHAIGQGFNRWVYTRMFMRSMVPKALAKLKQYPGLFDKHALLLAKDLYDFDNVFTGPLHGFDGTEDYWRRASAKPRLHDVKIPALVLNALNDPFVPTESLPQHSQVSQKVTLHYTAQGGHVGYAQGLPPANVHAMPQMVGNWLKQHLE